MTDIFLSYASEDRERVRPLAEALETKGYQVWWDRGLAAGDDYARVIGAALEQARLVIVCWTPASVASIWVRDEAARARDAGKLVPVMFDQCPIPLGFGAIQAEDFSRWNGAPDAAQMQLLHEAIKARLEGRAVDAGAVAGKRARLGRRIRLVTALTTVAALVGIAAGVSTILNHRRQAAQPPVTAELGLAEQLLQLVRDGTITPEQAIELARILESGAFEGGQAAVPESAGPQPPSLDVALANAASVDPIEFSALARELYRANVESLLRSADPLVREAALALSSASTRAEAFDTLWLAAEAGAPEAHAIWLVCGAVGYATQNPRGLEALERARQADPNNFAVWRLLGYAYAQTDRLTQAQGTALVGAGLAAQQAQEPDTAEQHLGQALPALEDPLARSFVQAELGDVALARGESVLAAERFQQALQMEMDAPDAAGGEAYPDLEASAEMMRLSVRQRYALALDDAGREREACIQLRAAAQAGQALTEAPPALLTRCGVTAPLLAPPSTGPVGEPAPDRASNTQAEPVRGPSRALSPQPREPQPRAPGPRPPPQPGP